MRYPIPRQRRALIFWVMLALTVVINRLMAGPLTTPAAPYGIVSLELAGTEANARAIIDSWDAAAREQALFGVRLDYLFLLTYSTAISLGCVWAASLVGERRWLASAGLYLAWLQWLAALFDAIENVGLLYMLGGQTEQPWPLIAQWFAIPKFALIVLGLLYTLVIGVGLWLRRRLSRAPAEHSAGTLNDL
ncbi:MAG TPA: hypothetical protein VGD69_29270 [Herpetosiphonaceae bacterium]